MTLDNKLKMRRTVGMHRALDKTSLQTTPVMTARNKRRLEAKAKRKASSR